MSTRNLEYLERILNKTTLTSKKATHRNIIGLGDELLKKTYIDVDAMKADAVKTALAEAEIHHGEQTEALMEHMRQEAEKDEQLALSHMKNFYGDQARRIAEQRDKAEAEKIRQLRKQHEQEKQDALQKQKEDILAETEKKIQDALSSAEKKLRQELALEREKAIAKALAKAREAFKRREEEVILKTRQECEKEAEVNATKVASMHAQEIHALQSRLDQTRQRLEREKQEGAILESDFENLQNEFMRFVDYSAGGKFSSSYLFIPRRTTSRSKTDELPASVGEVKIMGKSLDEYFSLSK